MQHKCTYFHVVDGVRVCAQCGQPAHSEGVIEDKMVEPQENKQIWPPESKRITRVANKAQKRR